MSKKWINAFGVNLALTLVAISYSAISHAKEIPTIKSKNEVLANFFKHPIYFESNEGQTDSSVKYLTRGPGYTFYFTPQEIFTVFSRRSVGDETSFASALKLTFLGANPSPLLTGMQEMPSKSNYFIGNDSKQWHTNVPNYARVSYQNLYDGIDAEFYGNPQQLEYDLFVSPGTDPQNIRFRIEGAKELTLDSQGNLQILTEDIQQIVMQKPIVYQLAGAEKNAVDGHYILLAKHEVGFALGNYDKAKMLVIDPIIYSTYLGSTTSDGSDTTSYGIAVDGSGSAYVTGSTYSSDFPTTAGAFQSGPAGVPNAFITKLNPAGSSLVYSTYLGGSNDDSGQGIAVDSSGSVYVTGYTKSGNFPTTIGAFQLARRGGVDAFITKLNPAGSSLVYSTYLGGSSYQSGQGIAADSSGNAYVTGYTGSGDFPITAGAFQSGPAGGQNAFITKLNCMANAPLSYSTYLGGSSYQSGQGIAADSSGNAYVTGSTDSSDFPITAGAFQSSLLGNQNAFITKLNCMANAPLSYSTYLGGSDFDQGNGVAIDSSGNAYVTGYAYSTDFPTTTGAFQSAFAGFQDAFIAKLDPAANGISSLLYSTYLGGSRSNSGNGIAVDSSGNVYVTGSTDSSDFPITAGAFQLVRGGQQDAFITKLNPAGSALLYSTYLGGSGLDQGNGIAIDSSGGVYVTGYTVSSDFPTTTGAFQTVLQGDAASFIAKFQLEPIVTGLTPSSGPASGGTVVTIMGSGFLDATAVNFGGNAASFVVISDTEIRATSPPGVGIVDVTVTRLDGTSATSAADEFTYLYPPLNFSGTQIKNQFLTQTDLVNALTWNAPNDLVGVSGYKIYRDSALTELIATLPANKVSYQDHNRHKGVAYTYYIVTTYSSGLVSSAASVTVKPK